MKFSKLILSIGVLIIVLSNLLAFFTMNLYVKLLNAITGGFAYNGELWLKNIHQSILLLGVIIVIYQLSISILAHIKHLN